MILKKEKKDITYYIQVFKKLFSYSHLLMLVILVDLCKYMKKKNDKVDFNETSEIPPVVEDKSNQALIIPDIKE